MIARTPRVSARAPIALLAALALAPACTLPSSEEADFRAPAHGGRWSSGEPDARVHPRLADAWLAGAAPAAPLIGRDSAMWLRALSLRPDGAGGDGATLTAQGLAPHPFRLILLVEEGGARLPLGEAASEAWSQGTHFARVEALREVPDGSVLLIRCEGAGRVVESRLRVRRG
jgi:hypothetical protein